MTDDRERAGLPAEHIYEHDICRSTSTAWRLALVTLSSGCTMKEQETPALTGPSELGTGDFGHGHARHPDAGRRLAVARDGQRMRLERQAAPQPVAAQRDHGRRSHRATSVRCRRAASSRARDGRATLVYTAPAAPAGPAVDNGTTVSITVTPLGTDFAQQRGADRDDSSGAARSCRAARRPAACVHVHSRNGDGSRERALRRKLEHGAVEQPDRVLRVELW